MKKSFVGFACLFVYFVFLSCKVFAQPSAGDMVVLGIDAVNDKITFATLVDILAGTEIKITDRGWDNETNAFITAMTGDGIVTWTPTTNINAGAILSLVLGGSDNIPATSLINVTTNTNLTNEAVFSGYSVSDPILTTGDQIFIYRGNEDNPYFIFGLNASGNINLDANYWQTSITLSLTQSTLPNGVGSQNSLVAGFNAVGVLTNPGGANAALQQFDNVFYNGPISSGDKATWLARIVNNGNWSGDDSGAGITSVGTILGTSAIILPVIWGQIEAKRSDMGYILSWQTLSETNNDHFEVQASKDGIVFTTIATAKSQTVDGNSDKVLQYKVSIDLAGSVVYLGLGLLSFLIAASGKKGKWMSVTTVLILSISWYACSKNNQKININEEQVYMRLAQVDKDGTRSYSKVIAVKNNQ